MTHPVCVSSSYAPGFNGLQESLKWRCLLSFLLPLPLFWKYITTLTLYSRNIKGVRIAWRSLSFCSISVVVPHSRSSGKHRWFGAKLLAGQPTDADGGASSSPCFILHDPPPHTHTHHCHCSAWACRRCQRHSNGLQRDPCASPASLLISPWASSWSSPLSRQPEHSSTTTHTTPLSATPRTALPRPFHSAPEVGMDHPAAQRRHQLMAQPSSMASSGLNSKGNSGGQISPQELASGQGAPGRCPREM